MTESEKYKLRLTPPPPPAVPAQIGRLYATKHLRVLLRAGVEFFSSWGMELLVTQLHDHSKAVSMEALDILDEACEDKVTDSAHTNAHVSPRR